MSSITTHVAQPNPQAAGMPGQKPGAGLAIIGGLGYLVMLLLHGDLPDHTTEAALAHPFVHIRLLAGKRRGHRRLAMDMG
jgi:hypothetical protein